MHSRTQRIMQLATKSNTDREELNQSIGNLSEDSDDTVKDKDFVLSDSEEDVDLVSSSFDNDINDSMDSEEDNIPLAILRERYTEKEIRKVLNSIIEEVSNNLDSNLYTKKGTLRKRRKFETSPATRKRNQLNKKRQKYLFIKENCGEKCKKNVLPK